MNNQLIFMLISVFFSIDVRHDPVTAIKGLNSLTVKPCDMVTKTSKSHLGKIVQ